MTIAISEKILLSTKKTYHLLIKLNDRNYTFIAEVLKVGNDDDIVISLIRTDRAKLKTSEKKLIKTTIQKMF